MVIKSFRKKKNSTASQLQNPWFDLMLGVTVRTFYSYPWRFPLSSLGSLPPVVNECGNVCVCTVPCNGLTFHPECILIPAECSWDRLQTRCDLDQDKVLTGNERIGKKRKKTRPSVTV